MRWLLVPLRVPHGLIHLTGFPMVWGGDIEGLTADTVIPLAARLLLLPLDRCLPCPIPTGRPAHYPKPPRKTTLPEM